MSLNTASTKIGSLTIAGSGIASVAHMTLETLAHLQEADSVFYVVTDPATEAFIHKNAKGVCKDLQIFYDKNKPRYDTYVQMAETMLNAVREGQKVLGIFYGHPGVFVSPSRRALAIAREEGYEAKMLPGISAEDYMFADLEFDPATHGCCAYEATHLLLKNIPLDTSVNNVLWQVGGVGVTKMDFENSKFKLLVDRLEQDFGPDHKVVHYIGAVLPQSTTVKDVYAISDLRKPEIAAHFNACSTLYVPPLKGDDPFPLHVIEQLFGTNTSTVAQVLYPVAQWDLDNKLPAVPAYGDHELEVVAALTDHSVPADYRPLVGSPALQQLMIDLSLRPSLQAKYKANPKAIVDATPGLTTVESAALQLRTPGPIFGVMKPKAGAVVSLEDVKDYHADDSSFLIVILIIIANVLVPAQ